MKGGYFLIWDDQAKRPRVLQLVRVHEKLNKLTAADYERLFKTKAPAPEVYAVQALRAVKGVKEAKAVDEGVVVTLKPDKTVRYGDLVAALQKAGITVRERVEDSQERQRQVNQQGSQGDDCCSPPKEEGTQRGGCCG